MEGVPPQIESYGILGLIIWLVGKEAVKPLLDSFIEKNKKKLESELSIKKSDQEVLQTILIDAVKRIPDCLDSLRDSINRQIEKEDHRATVLEQILKEKARIAETVNESKIVLAKVDGKIDALLTHFQS